MFLIACCLLITFAGAANTSKKNANEQLMLDYANSIGVIRFTQKVTDYIGEFCQLSISIARPVLNSVDYQMRLKSGYSYLEFVNLMGEYLQIEKQAEDVATKLITEITGCTTENLQAWYTETITPLVNDELKKLATMETIYGLPQIQRSKGDLIKHFEQKLNSFRRLSNDEVGSLALALESGFYRYALLSHTEVEENLELALTLRHYLVEQTTEPKSIYQLAQTMSRINKVQSLEHFKLSAEQGFTRAQIWLGTYYACNNRKVDALFWLNQAEQKDLQTVNLIKLEIQDLGIPTNCYDGWVH